MEDVPPVFLAAPELHLVRVVDGFLHAQADLFRQAPETVLREKVQAADLGVAEKVLFLGEVPYAELPAVYAAADAKVISSDYESFCFAAIEAMSTGLPVLTTDCAWVPRLVADGAGLVVPAGDVAALAAGLKKLAENPALRRRLGATGRQQVLERHTWPASADTLRHLYRKLTRTASDAESR